MLLFKTFSGYPPPGNGDPSPCRVLLELASSCFCGFQRPPLSLAPSHSSPSPYILCSACLTSGLTPQDSRVLGLGAPSQPSSRPELHVFLGAPRARPSSCPESPSCRPPPFPARSFLRPACVAPQPPARGRGLCGCCMVRLCRRQGPVWTEPAAERSPFPGRASPSPRTPRMLTWLTTKASRSHEAKCRYDEVFRL